MDLATAPVNKILKELNNTKIEMVDISERSLKQVVDICDYLDNKMNDSDISHCVIITERIFHGYFVTYGDEGTFFTYLTWGFVFGRFHLSELPDEIKAHLTKKIPCLDFSKVKENPDKDSAEHKECAEITELAPVEPGGPSFGSLALRLNIDIEINEMSHPDLSSLADYLRIARPDTRLAGDLIKTTLSTPMILHGTFFWSSMPCYANIIKFACLDHEYSLYTSAAAMPDELWKHLKQLGIEV